MYSILPFPFVQQRKRIGCFLSTGSKLTKNSKSLSSLKSLKSLPRLGSLMDPSAVANHNRSSMASLEEKYKEDPFKDFEIPKPKLLPIEELEIDMDEEKVRERWLLKQRREEAAFQAKLAREEMLQSIDKQMQGYLGAKDPYDITYDFKGKVVVIPPVSKNKNLSPKNGSIVTKLKIGTFLGPKIEDPRKYTNLRYKKDHPNRSIEEFVDEIEEPRPLGKKMKKKEKEAGIEEEDLVKLIKLTPGVSMKQGTKIFLNPLVQSANQIPTYPPIGQYTITKKQYDEMMRPEQPFLPIKPPSMSELTVLQEIKVIEPENPEPPQEAFVSRPKVLKMAAFNVIRDIKKLEQERLANSQALALIRRKNNTKRAQTQQNKGIRSLEASQVTLETNKNISELIEPNLEKDQAVNETPDVKRKVSKFERSPRPGMKLIRPKSQAEIQLSQLDAYNMQLLSGRNPMFAGGSQRNRLNLIGERGLGLSQRQKVENQKKKTNRMRSPNLFMTQPEHLPHLPPPSRVGNVIGHGFVENDDYF